MSDSARECEAASGAAAGGGLRARLRRGITWNIVGAMFNQGSMFAVNVVVARILGGDETGRNLFGEFSTLQTTALTVFAVAQLATGITATKYVAEFRSVDRTRAGQILALCGLVSLVMAVVASVVLLLAATPLAELVLGRPHLARGLMIVSGVALFAVLNGYQMGALAGLESYRALAWGGAVAGVSRFALCGLLAWKWGLYGALAGLVGASLVRWALFSRLLAVEARRQGITARWRQAWSQRDILIKFSLPAAVAGLTTMPALWLATAFLVREKHTVAGLAEAGLYGAANNLRLLVLLLPILINNVGVSLLNNQRGLNDPRRYRQIFWVNMAAVCGGAVCIGGLMVLVGPWALRAFGKSFDAARAALMIMMISVVPEALAVSAFQVMQSREKMWLSFFAVALPRDCTIVVLAYILAPRYGAAGVASAYAIAWSLACLSIVIITCVIGVAPRDRGPNPK